MEIELEKSWKEVLKDEMSTSYFKELMVYVEHQYIATGDRIFPKKSEIFQALNLCPIDSVKVVILGQDPYPTKGFAHGLCFSVEETVFPFPKSLNNIFKELESDTGKPIPANGNLQRWAEQGVLMLNTVLTVEEGKPDSHAGKGWERFTDAVLSVINQEQTEIVYLLWGSKAQTKAEKLDAQRNLILKTVHPSPLSAYRGFFGSKHFSQANSYLLTHGKKPINW
jgi:uracil-DNA glycosylase